MTAYGEGIATDTFLAYNHFSNSFSIMEILRMPGPFSRRGILAVALLLPCVSGCGYGPKVENANIEVYYKDGATKAEAERLAAYLTKLWAGPGDRRSVQLTKKGDSYQFRMVVKKEFQNNNEALQDLAFDAARVSRDVFAGAPVELHACDERLNTIKVVPPRDDVRYGVVEGKVEVFFSSPDRKADAERMAKFLAGELQNAAVTFTLVRHPDVIEVHMVIRKELQDDADTLEGLRQTGKAISANVFKGTPVEMQLCDEHLKVLRVLKP